MPTVEMLEYKSRELLRNGEYDSKWVQSSDASGCH